MDFFSWFNYPLALIQLFREIPETALPDEIAAQALSDYFWSIGIAAGIFLVCLIMGGIGLNTMAKKAGRAQSVCAYLPFANTWFAGEIAGESNFFGQKMKRAGLYAMLAEILWSGLELFRLILNFQLTNGAYYCLKMDVDTNVSMWEIDRAKIPADRVWQYDALQYTQYISVVIEIFVILFLCVMFFALFRKYYARSPVLMMLLCTLFPFRGFILFAVRNNTPIDYSEFMRRRAEEYARRYQTYGPQGQQPPQNPQGQSAPQEDPFTEFKKDSDGSDDVFKDF